MHGLAGADIPLFRVKGDGPRPPGFRRIVDGEAAGKTGVFACAGLAPEVSLQPCVVTDAGAVTHSGIAESGSTRGNVAGPERPGIGIEAHEKLVSGAVANAILVHARTSTNRNRSNITLVFSSPELELRQWTVKDNQGGITTVALQGAQSGGTLDEALFTVPVKTPSKVTQRN